MAPVRAVAYLRVSTEDQAEKGISLDAQRAAIEVYARSRGLDVVSVHVDAGASGKSVDRPGLQEALASIAEGGAGALVVAKLDRLSRSVGDIDDLLTGLFGEGGAVLHSVSEPLDVTTPMGRFMVRIMACIAQLERETTVERTVTALDHKRAKGQRTGALPLGHRLSADGKTLEPDPVEQAAIALAREMHAAGASNAAIVRRLAADGFVSRAGVPYRATQVARMLAR